MIVEVNSFGGQIWWKCKVECLSSSENNTMLPRERKGRMNKQFKQTGRVEMGFGGQL